MSNYDAVVGINVDNINHFASQFHEAVYPNQFKGTAPFELLKGLLKGELHYDAQKAPTVSFNSDLANEYYEKEEKEATEGAINLEIVVPDVKVGVGLKDKSELIERTLIVTAAAEANLNEEGKLQLTILTAKVNLDDGKPLDGTLEKVISWFIPNTIKKVNAFLAEKPIVVPPLKFEVSDTTFEFNMPILKQQENTLMAFTTLKENGEVEPPESLGVSDTKVSVSASERILNNVLQKLEPNLGDSDTYDTEILKIEFKASYDAHVEDPVLKLKEGNEVTADFTLVGGGKVNFYGPLPGGIDNGDFSFTMGANPVATGTIEVEDGEFKLELNSIDDFKIKFDISGIPDFIEDVISDFTNELLSPIRALISKVIKGKEFNLAELPQSDFDVAGTELTLTLTDPEVNTLDLEDGQKLLSINVTPDLKKKEEA